MGQSVSVDEEPADLKDLLSAATQAQAQPFKAAAPNENVPLKHYMKVWRFERGAGHAVLDAPVPLCDEQGLLMAEPQRHCSYLILHVRAAQANNSEVPPSGAAVAGLEELASRAGGACTPRGLAIEVASQTEPAAGGPNTGGTGGPSGGAASGAGSNAVAGGLRYSVFVWHGVDADPRVKARVFARAFELERLLRLGLLRRPAQADAMQRAKALEGVRWPVKPGEDVAAVADSLRRSRNRLLTALLESSSSCQPRAPGGTAPQMPAGSKRFPRLGLSVCRSLGLAPAAGWTPDKAPPMVVVPMPGPHQHPAPIAMQGQLRVPGGKGPNVMPVLNFSAIREAAGSEVPPQRQREIVNPSPVPTKPRESAPRGDGPIMLNLEEINVSEEELINSYDPDNEVNNYHLPNHLYKQLQLKQYRQMCSEVIANTLYISSYQVAADLEVLRRHGITHIVNSAADICDNRFVSEFVYCTYYLKDTNSEEISLLFYRTIEWIHDAITRGGRVLVHCREGVSRSSTFIMAYLMWRFKIAFEVAHERVRKVRPICNPNTGFTCQLLNHGKRLGVSGGPQSGPQSGHNAQGDRPSVFRVTPHHPKEPFLLLVPVEWAPTWSVFDPRFVWVVLRGTQCTCWIGAQSDAEPARAAVQQHMRWAESFERIRYAVAEVHDGAEPPSFWATLGIPGPPADRSSFSAPRAAFDEDAEVLRVGPHAANGAGDASGGVLDERERPPATPQSPAAQLDGAPCSRALLQSARRMPEQVVSPVGS